MAITRTQQAKQMLREGGRIGFKNGPAGGASASGNYGGDSSGGYSDKERAENRTRGGPPGTDTITKPPVQDKYGEETQKRFDEYKEDFINEPITLPDYVPPYLQFLKGPFEKGKAATRKFNIDKVAKAGRYTYTDPETGETYTFDQDLALSNPEIFEAANKQLLQDRLAGKVDAYGNPLSQGNDDQPIIPLLQDPMTTDQATEELIEEEEEPFQLARAFRADGGRMGYQQGGIMPRLNQLSGNVSSAEQMLQEINQRLQTAESSLGSGDQGTFLESVPPPGNRRPFLGQPFQADKRDYDVLGKNIFQGNATLPTAGSPLQQAMGFADGGSAEGIMGGLADGQMDEMGRQMYGLGKLVKKATRAVKKIAKSPIGKAALLYAGAGALGNLAQGSGLGGMFKGFMSPSSFVSKSKLGGIFSGQGFKNILFGAEGIKGLPGSSGLIGTGGTFSPFKAFAGLTALSALTPAQEKQAQLLADETGLDINDARNQILQAAAGQQDDRARAFKAGGGIMRLGYQEGGDAEPVAKKTMPLLDMDGKEKDYRETGGFVDMGRMERADDVPARLSKNEFVFTADAVRNAGDGDIDKGAEVMYNMMKNLENGGDVSEESQGLEGARRMFQTSQRLEEVL